jgi:hypothetical protein
VRDSAHPIVGGLLAEQLASVPHDLELLVQREDVSGHEGAFTRGAFLVNAKKSSQL